MVRIELVGLCTLFLQFRIVVIRVVLWIGIDHPLTAEHVGDFAALFGWNLLGASVRLMPVGTSKPVVGWSAFEERVFGCIADWHDRRDRLVVHPDTLGEGAGGAIGESLCHPGRRCGRIG